jgi:hypothetical protein
MSLIEGVAVIHLLGPSVVAFSMVLFNASVVNTLKGETIPVVLGFINPVQMTVRFCGGLFTKFNAMYRAGTLIKAPRLPAAVMKKVKLVLEATSVQLGFTAWYRYSGGGGGGPAVEFCYPKVLLHASSLDELLPGAPLEELLHEAPLDEFVWFKGPVAGLPAVPLVVVLG